MNQRRKVKPMAIYLIVDVNIDDPQSYAEYSKQVGPMVARYGGKIPGARRRNLDDRSGLAACTGYLGYPFEKSGT
jgi:hypothetical protein